MLSASWSTGRRRLLALAPTAWLAGCAASAEMPAAAPAVAAPQGTALLTPWLTITGGWRADALPASTRWTFSQPVALAARQDALWVADAGSRQLVRIERGRDRLAIVAAIGADPGMVLQLGAGGTLWLAEPLAGQVRQLDAAGRTLITLRDERLLARPTAVLAAPGADGEVFVADAAPGRVVVFDARGRVRRHFGQGRLQSAVALAWLGDELLVLDRLAQQLLRFGRDGALRSVLVEDGLVAPRALAADAAGRVYVGDEADGSIHAFIAGVRVARLGGQAGGRIDALAVDGNLLFVADGAQARVRVLLLAPESLRRSG